MTAPWRFVSEDSETISLHDHYISSSEEAGLDLMLHFDRDGIDVTGDNSLNSTGRHRNTGPAVMVLKNWRWGSGVWGRNVFRLIRLENGQEQHIPLPLVPLSREQFLNQLELQVLYFKWDPEKHMLNLNGNGYMECPPSGTDDGFVDIELHCDRLLFCWNDLPRDAWFQNH